MQLASRDSDLVWLMVVQLVPDALPPSPHPSLRTVKVKIVDCLHLSCIALFFVLCSYSYHLVHCHHNTKQVQKVSSIHYEFFTVRIFELYTKNGNDFTFVL